MEIGERGREEGGEDKSWFWREGGRGRCNGRFPFRLKTLLLVPTTGQHM